MFGNTNRSGEISNKQVPKYSQSVLYRGQVKRYAVYHIYFRQFLSNACKIGNVRNVTVWRVRVTIVAVETQQCILRFFHTINGKIFLKMKLVNTKLCFDFLYNIRLKHFSF